jgi:hypothetical protein
MTQPNGPQPALSPPSQAALGRVTGAWPAVAVWASTGILVFRFFWCIHRYSVNLFFSDDWVYFDVLSQRLSYWQMFVMQHGPHREGVGMVLASYLLRLSSWNSRVEAYLQGTVIVAAALLALWLKVRIFGPLQFADLIIPLMFLSLAQWELLAGGPGPSPQAFPLMLIMAYCLAWLQRNSGCRLASVVLINFLLIFTGYGIFIAGITILLLGVEFCRGLQLREKQRIVSSLSALLVALASIALFFRGYVFSPAAECYRFPWGNPLNYPVFIAMMLARFVGIKHQAVLATMVGLALLTALIGLVARHASRILRLTFSSDNATRTIFILGGYALIQATAVAIGRICLGMETSQSSRYMTLLIPAFLSLYFGIVAGPAAHKWRKAALALLFIGVLAGSIQRNHKELEGVAKARETWKECFISRENVDFCTAITGTEIYLPTQHRQLMRKLQYLKTNRLNLYSTSN